MLADYKLGGFWGCHVSLSDPKNFDPNAESIRVYGHHPVRPKVGDTLMGEFQKSFIKFKFVKVKYCHDPADMFFAEVKAIDQEMKTGNR